MRSIGILAYGSLICDPGIEITPLIKQRIKTMTPFPVEFARYSKSRGGAPTVVPHPAGKSVAAEILVISDQISLNEAKNLLWRREIRKEGTGRIYSESAAQNAVVIREKPSLDGIDVALYTDFNTTGKIPQPDPYILAEAAISSIARASPGSDGISYLISLIEAGVETGLIQQYQHDILTLTKTGNLVDALLKAKQLINRRENQ